MNTVTITYYGVEATGRNVTEAKKEAGKKIEHAMSGSYCPELLQSRGVGILFYRTPDGWHHSYVTDESGKVRTAPLSHGSGQDRDDARATAIMSLAQSTWDGKEQYPPCLMEIPAYRTRKGDIGLRLLAEFDSWRGFQLAYRHAKATMTEGNIDSWHRWACDHSREFAA